MQANAEQSGLLVQTLAMLFSLAWHMGMLNPMHCASCERGIDALHGRIAGPLNSAGRADSCPKCMC